MAEAHETDGEWRARDIGRCRVLRIHRSPAHTYLFARWYAFERAEGRLRRSTVSSEIDIVTYKIVPEDNKSASTYHVLKHISCCIKGSKVARILSLWVKCMFQNMVCDNLQQ
jgi:hypothetical protein